MPDAPPVQPAGPSEAGASERLDSWKEVAGYLKRSLRTVQRWGHEQGLPVHRHGHGKQGTVYAYKAELDAWWRNGGPRIEQHERAREVAQRRVAWTLGAAGLVVLGLFSWMNWRWRERLAPAPPTHIVQLTTLSGLEHEATWSPDGRAIAYASDAAGNLDVYVQPVGAQQAVRLTESDADDAQPAWSPDGTRIAFVSARAYPQKRLSTLFSMAAVQPFLAGENGDVWVMPALGETARQVARDAYYPAWSPDGKKLVYAAVREGQWGLWVQEVDAGSAPRALALGRLSVPVVICPAWSPDGKWIAFAGGGGATSRIYVVPSGGGEALALTSADSVALTPSWSPDGQWLFFSSNRGGPFNLWKARFEEGRLSSLHQETTGSGHDLRPHLDPSGHRLLYSNVRVNVNVWELDPGTGSAVQVTSETTTEAAPRPSPDGSSVIFASNRSGGNAVWLMDRKNGNLKQVSTAYEPVVEYMEWSPEGKYLFYLMSRRDSSQKTVWQYELDSESLHKVYEGALRSGTFCVSAQARYLILAQAAPQQGIVRIELSSGKSELLAQPASGVAFDAACSADGRWVAYHVERGNQRKIWVVPHSGGAAQQLTFGDSEDSHPAWSPDSRLVYFTRNHHDIYEVSRSGGEPRRVTGYQSFSIAVDYPATTPGGKTILFNRNDTTGDIYILEYRSR